MKVGELPPNLPSNLPTAAKSKFRYPVWNVTSFTASSWQWPSQPWLRVWRFDGVIKRKAGTNLVGWGWREAHKAGQMLLSQLASFTAETRDSWWSLLATRQQLSPGLLSSPGLICISLLFHFPNCGRNVRVHCSCKLHNLLMKVVIKNTNVHRFNLLWTRPKIVIQRGFFCQLNST